MTTKKAKTGPITQATAGVAQRADEALTQGEQKYDATKDALTQKYNAARTKVTNTAENAKTKALETHENAKTFVKENPEKSIGMAVGVGALLGAVVVLALTRRR